ncbi:MAG: hypothetical protein M3068_11375 [Gemmatimonadota bacterium]|nr:hypothetical protein [Gemmatimonadota bacterium]
MQRLAALGTRGLASLAAALIVGACVVAEKKPAADTVVVAVPGKTTPAPRVQPAPAAAVAPSSGNTPSGGTGTLALKDASFDSVNVEVRIGANPDCGQNQPFGTRELRRGETWTITTDQDVCWRREADPARPGGAWTAWNRQSVRKGDAHNATL